MCVTCGCQHPEETSTPSPETARRLQVEVDVLSANQHHADHNRQHFAAHRVTALNLLSSPGAGKTTLLCRTIQDLSARQLQPPVMVIEGDQQTSLDADRIRATGAQAVQINTGKGCHLDAAMVGRAFGELHQDMLHEHGQNDAVLMIENVGNLVCPALWDLGEAAKVLVLSVTEGDDKPSKYPDMFAAADLLILHKTDLMPYVDFDVASCVARARALNPDIQVLEVSSRTGDGVDAWLDWLLQQHAQHRQGHGHGHGHAHQHEQSHN